jgi:pilus assembly protein CpaD
MMAGRQEMAKQMKMPAVCGVLAALALGVTGCGFNGAEQAQYDASRVHPISVEADVSTLNINVTPGQPALSDLERAAIARFAGNYRERGHGPLTVSTPSGSPNSSAAAGVLTDVRDVLAEQGVSKASLAYTPYRASATEGSAPLILSFKRYVAKASPCGDWSTSYSFDPNNVTPPNFGCATQNNLAAMIAEPADLLGPRDMTPADAARRTTVLEKYRAGEQTATARSDQDSGAVSKVDQ